MRLSFLSVFALAAALAWGCNDSGTLNPGPDPLPSPNPGPDPVPDAYAEARVAAVNAINGYRATLQLSPLSHWSDADSCADQEARHDAVANQAHKSFGSCSEWAQNECLGWPSTDSVVSGCLDYMWSEGPGSDWSQHGHYINMSNPNYTKVSIGFYTTPEGKVWSVQNFK